MIFQLDPVASSSPEPGALSTDMIRGVKVSPRQSPEDNGRINRSLKIESLSCHMPR